MVKPQTFNLSECGFESHAAHIVSLQRLRAGGLFPNPFSFTKDYVGTQKITENSGAGLDKFLFIV